MLKWVEILKRILKLYGVRTQAELGMAMGIPLSIGMGESANGEIIPWPILERVVHDKNVSWDWLLTGGEKAAEGGKATDSSEKPLVEDAPAADAAATAEGLDNRKSRAAGLPRIETRELRRELLQEGGSEEAAHADEERESGDVIAELTYIRTILLREMDRINTLLDRRRG